MGKRVRWGVSIGLLLGVLLILALQLHLNRERRAVKFERSFPTMGTIAAFQLFAPPETAQHAAEEAQAEFNRIVGIANLYDPQSELSRLNATAAGQPFVCSDELWLLLQEARQAYRFSGGAFDITAKPLMDLWGFYRKRKPGTLPTAAELAEARAKVGLDLVQFDDEAQSVFFPVPGMAFDLGGLAKGYAVDLAAEAAMRNGVHRGVIDLGGNLRLLPLPPPGQSEYRVAIRDPRNREQVTGEVLELLDEAVSTSGDYERFVMIGNRRYGHIMDPKTGEPTEGDYSVTVVAPSALLADWLSTAIFLRGESLAEQAEAAFPGVRVTITDP